VLPDTHKEVVERRKKHFYRLYTSTIIPRKDPPIYTKITTKIIHSSSNDICPYAGACRMCGRSCGEGSPGYHLCGLRIEDPEKHLSIPVPVA
jgi:hypothetical protein